MLNRRGRCPLLTPPVTADRCGTRGQGAPAGVPPSRRGPGQGSGQRAGNEPALMTGNYERLGGGRINHKLHLFRGAGRASSTLQGGKVGSAAAAAAAVAVVAGSSHAATWEPASARKHGKTGAVRRPHGLAGVMTGRTSHLGKGGVQRLTFAPVHCARYGSRYRQPCSLSIRLT